MRHHYPSAAAREREIVESYTYPHHEQTYDAFETDIAVLYVYFGQPTTTEYIRVVSLSWVGFLAQAGGLIGACLGFSFISLVEIVYWFIIRFCRLSKIEKEKMTQEAEVLSARRQQLQQLCTKLREDLVRGLGVAVRGDRRLAGGRSGRRLKQAGD